MTLPSFNAEQSLYRSSRHYRASALASVVGGIRPSDDCGMCPDGSYKQTCFDCCFNGSDLYCNCHDENGYPVVTRLYETIDFCEHQPDIYNNNGQLSCC